MMRRPILIALAALLAVLVAGPVILLLLGGSPGPTGQARASASAPAATDASADGPLEPGDVGWVFAPWLFGQGPGNRYVLQAGTLADPEPVIDMEIPWAADQETQVGRVPAVGPAIDGMVVYVTDDGVGTAIHRLQITANAEDEVLAEMREIVWSMAVAPDGLHAYLALVDREDDEQDLGVVEVALDGSGDMREVMAPSRPQANDPAGMRLAAIAFFGVDLIMSSDGGHLVRRTCGEGACTIDVLDLASGDVIDLGAREMMGAGGGVILSSRCAGVRCFTEAIDLATGVAQELPFQGEAGITSFDGRAAIVYIELGEGGAVLRALDPFDGEIRDLLRVGPGSTLMLIPPQGDLRISMPPGYVHAAVATDGDGKGGAVIPFTDVAVPLGGGAVIELPTAPIRHPDGIGVQG